MSSPGAGTGNRHRRLPLTLWSFVALAAVIVMVGERRASSQSQHPADRPESRRPGESSSPAGELTVERMLTVLPTSAGESLDLSASDLGVLFDGRPQTVLSAGSISSIPQAAGRGWAISVWVDPQLVSPTGLARSVAGLHQSAGRLTALGTVEIVTTDPYAETLLPPTRDAAALRAALDELGELGDGAGELAAMRQEFERWKEDGTLIAEERQEALSAELELLHKRKEEFIAWLASRQTEGPACLILIHDGFDLEPVAFYLGSRGESTGGGEIETRLFEEHQMLGRLLSSAGWITSILAAGTPLDSLFADRLAPLALLASATGGEVLTDPGSLAQFIERLERGWLLTTELTGTADGLPRPLSLETSSGLHRLTGPRWQTVATPLLFSETRAQRLFEDPAGDHGSLAVTGTVRPDPDSAAATGAMPALVETLVSLADPRASKDPIFRVSLLVARAEAAALVSHDLVEPERLGAATAWLYRTSLDLPEDFTGAVAVIEDLRSRHWGAASLELSDRGARTNGQRVSEWTTPRVSSPSPPRIRSHEAGSVIRLLPPRKRPATGSTRFDTLVSSPLVRRVEFLLDGEMAATDAGAPFAATLDLGPEPVTHRISALAYAGDGSRIGEHTIIVNPGPDIFQVRITEMSATPAGSLRVVAAVDLPAASPLSRVEFYRNDTLVETLESPPFQVELSAPKLDAQEILRVVAHLADGTWIDDAQLLSAERISERIEVNLVELHLIVTDSKGSPVRGLEADDFTVELRGEQQSIESLALAKEVPLTLGLVIDTSESMWPLMPDTKKAGAQFLANTLAERDRAFLVDFDTQPRLAHAATDRVIDLLRTFNGLSADGFTALYDAVIFSLLQFEEAVGRKALVLLTDGDDYKSRYGPRRCIQYGQRLGVPVYIVSLAGIQNPRRLLRRIDLEGITEGTGGKVFYISDMSQLADAYSRINDELRSQYVLTFVTDRLLAENDLAAVEIRVAGPSRKVRAVIGGQQLQ